MRKLNSTEKSVTLFNSTEKSVTLSELDRKKCNAPKNSTEKSVTQKVVS